MSKLQEITMTTPEQLKEEFEKECELYQLFDNENYGDNLPYECQKLRVTNFWLNKIQSLLGEIEGRIEGERKSKTFPQQLNGFDGKTTYFERLSDSDIDYNQALDKAVSIIQEYKGKKI